ncbi:MAG: hypothetical protein HQL16_02440 [Candidatus Omnitrophica bacterium]|nr:hypothetical protein [Candidatus Omnitrophota bacterium]
MKLKYFLLTVMILAILGCGKATPPKNIVAQVNDYQISLEEFELNFLQSPYASRNDLFEARKDYLESLINQKLIIQDAQKRNVDKQKEFLSSIEHFWEQSLLTIYLGMKTKEISGSVHVPQEAIRKLYDQMVKDGLTTKTYEELYPQISWQAAKDIESRKLNDWTGELRKTADVKINANLLKDGK